MDMDIKKISKLFPGKNFAKELTSFDVLAFERNGLLTSNAQYAATEPACLIIALNNMGCSNCRTGDVMLMNRFTKGAYQETGFTVTRPFGYLFMPIGSKEVYSYRSDGDSHFSIASNPFRVFAKKVDNTIHFLICEQRKGRHIMATGEIIHPIIFDDLEEIKTFESPRPLADALKEYRPL